MKRISFFLTLTLLILSFGLINAEQSINIERAAIDGYFEDSGTDYLIANYNVVVPIRVTNTNNHPNCKFALSYAMELSTFDGATWSNLGLKMHVWEIIVYAPTFHDTQWVKDWWPQFFIDAAYDAANVRGFAGVCGAPDIGLREGADTTAWDLSFTTGAEGTICINQLGQAVGGFEWGWPSLALDATVTCDDAAVVDPLFMLDDDIISGGGSNARADAAGEAGCFVLGTPPDFPPEFTNTTTTIEGSHCATLTFNFDAVDPDPGAGPGPDNITYSADLGTINETTGVWSYTGDLSQVGTPLVLHVTATEADNPSTTTVTVNVNLTNTAPFFTSGCGQLVIAQTGQEAVATLTANDNCPGDPKTFEIESTNATGAAAFVGNVLHYTPDAADLGLMVFNVRVTDGVNASPTCAVTFQVSAGAPYAVVIEKTHNTIQGGFENVDIILTEQAEALGGYNLLIGYDASALTFQGAVPGTLLNECGWEYFTYRYGADGNCNGGCPSGLVRITAIAETNNGPNHPVEACVPEGDPTLATLSFLVSNDRTLECMYVPIRFFWIECGDNTLTNEAGTELYIAATTKDYDYEYVGYSNLMEEYPDAVLPTFVGPMGCATEDKVPVLEYIDFFNGGIDIVCADSIDARGDINLDGLAYTIADAVMYSNYFVDGMSALVYVPGVGFAGSVAASDVNADGLTLTVADLVYLIRVVVGDAQPYPKVTPMAANLTVGSTLSVDAAMGAAFVVLAGDQTPTLLADNMEMKARFDGENTRVLVWSQTGEIFTGEFLGNVGSIISTELAAADGSPVNSKLIPANFNLGQNYPNPFNPTTSIALSLPVASDYTITIYNVTGQVVDVISGSADAGYQTVEWDASNNASGVYFYKLNAGNFTDTKKMVLLK